MIDPVEHLARDDKWQLSAGSPDGALFAPAFPRWLDVPAFWDGATILQRGVAPLFTITVLDDSGQEVAARVTARRWTPAELTLQYRLGQGITATEVRTVHPGGIFVSEWRFAAYRPERIHLVAWTAQRASRIERESAKWNGALQFVVAAKTDEEDEKPLRVRAELACVGGAASWSAMRSEGRVPEPSWKLTPFMEQWRGNALTKTVLQDTAAPNGGTFFAAVHRTLDIEYSGASATFAMRLVADSHAAHPAESPAMAGTKQRTFGGASRKRWSEYFAEVPSFRCSDPYIETLYWYWQYVLRANPKSGAKSAPRDFAAESNSAVQMIAKRDRDESGLFDLPRDDPSIEVRTAGRIKGVEATVNAYRLFRRLAGAAVAANADPSRWEQFAEHTRNAVREKMWNPATSMFSDVDAKTRAHTNVKHARCFLPYGTDIADASHIAGLEQHLLNPREFFTAFPVPSLSLDDPRFSAEGEWKSRRAADPWNGRSHPEVNADIVDALAYAARSYAPQLRPQAAVLLRRFIRMMFHEGQLHRVNSHAHYNPLTGHASVYLGGDDIPRARIDDLIIRHVMGISADDQGITIDPLPFELEHAEISGMMIRGRAVDVLIEGDVVSATIDGAKTYGSIGTPMFFATPSAD